MCNELCGILCCFGCLTCCGCRNIVCRKLVFFPPPPMYEFDSVSEEMKSIGGAESNQTMWLTDARATKICPVEALSFHCYKIRTSRDETIAAFFTRVEKCVCFQRSFSFFPVAIQISPTHAHSLTFAVPNSQFYLAMVMRPISATCAIILWISPKHCKSMCLPMTIAGTFFFVASFVSFSEIPQSAKLECNYMLMHIIFVLMYHWRLQYFCWPNRSYGLSSGQPGIANVLADVEAAYDFLTKTLGIPSESIIAYVHH
jgi:hypothetical protein